MSGQWATTPVAAFVADIVFSPYWVVFFADKELKPGARWSASESGVAFTVEVQGECTVAGVKGFQGRWTARSPNQPEVVAEWCISPRLPLVLKATLKAPQQNASIEGALVEYRPGGAAPVPGAAVPMPAIGPSPGRPATPNALDGLYLGVSEHGTPLWYLFKPSGSVAVELSNVAVDPDAAAGWRMVSRRFYGPEGPEEKPPGDFFSVVLGSYELSADRVRFRTRELEVDVQQKIVLFDELWKGRWEKETVTEKSFRLLQGHDVIEMDGVRFFRQRDETGRRLAGEFFSTAGGLLQMRTLTARFTPNGQFSWDESAVTSAIIKGPYGALPPSSKAGTGRYEIRGQEIILYYSDGRVERKLFGYLGTDREGREVVVIGTDLSSLR